MKHARPYDHVFDPAANESLRDDPAIPPELAGKFFLRENAPYREAREALS
jgi:hypothetical protein